MAVIEISQDEKDDLTRDTLDRILYCKGYKEALVKLNLRYDPKEENTKVAYSPSKEFLFPLEKAI